MNVCDCEQILWLWLRPVCFHYLVSLNTLTGASSTIFPVIELIMSSIVIEATAGKNLVITTLT